MNSLNLSNAANKEQITESSNSLRRLYIIRASFSIAWVILAFAFAKDNQRLASFLFIVYPLWDAIATFLDINLSPRGQSKSPQYLNAVISILTTAAVVLAL